MKKVFQAQLYLNILMAVIILINYRTVKDWIYLGILAVAVVVLITFVTYLSCRKILKEPACASSLLLI